MFYKLFSSLLLKTLSGKSTALTSFRIMSLLLDDSWEASIALIAKDSDVEIPSSYYWSLSPPHSLLFRIRGL